MAFNHRALALSMGAVLSIAWALPAHANGVSEFYTVHNAAVSLQWAQQLTDFPDDTCRRDAEVCIDRGRINSRDLIGQLCQTSSPSRDYRLVVLLPCENPTDGWYIGVWDDENETLSSCDSILFENNFVLFAEDNNSNLREMRLLSDSESFLSVVNSTVGGGDLSTDLTVTSIVRFANLNSRLQDQIGSEPALAETLEGVANGIEEEEDRRCAASMRSSTTLGLHPAIEEEEEEDEGVMSIDTLLIEKGRITAGRPFAIYDNFID